MQPTHLIETTQGPWLGYCKDGRWIGRPAKRSGGGYVYTKRFKCDVLIPSIMRIVGTVG